MRRLFCRFEVEGFHKWTDAPSEFEYLRATHRHVFHFEVQVEVSTHIDRAIEFIDFKRRLKSRYAEPHDFGGDSCETIAQELFNYLSDNSVSVVQVTVSEDGENGAIISRS